MTTKRYISWMIIAGIFCAAGASIAAPAAGARKHRVAVTIKKNVEEDEESSKDEKDNPKNGTTRVTETDKEVAICTLDLTLKNPTEESDSYEVKTFFIGETVAKDSETIIFDKQSKTVSVDAKGSSTLQVVSKPCEYVKTVTTTEGGNSENSNPKEKESGKVYEGYLVVVKAGGNVIFKKGSSSKFASDKWIGKMNLSL